MDNSQQEDAANGGGETATETTTTTEPQGDAPQGKVVEDGGEAEHAAEDKDSAGAEENRVAADETVSPSDPEPEAKETCASQEDSPPPAESPPDVANDAETQEEPSKEDQADEAPEEKPEEAPPGEKEEEEQADRTEDSTQDVVKDTAPVQKEQVEEVKAESHPVVTIESPAEDDKSGASAAAVASPEEVQITEDAAKGGTEEKPEGAEAAAAGASSTPVNFTGKWKLYKHENFEEYLKAVGVYFVLRKIAVHSSPVTEIKQEANHFHVKTTTGFFSQELEFNIGKEFESSPPFGGKMKCMAVWEGDKQVTNTKPADETDKKAVSQTMTREIIDGELVMTMKIGEVVAKRFCKKME